jgi:hypothetical protein
MKNKPAAVAAAEEAVTAKAAELCGERSESERVTVRPGGRRG